MSNLPATAVRRNEASVDNGSIKSWRLPGQEQARLMETNGRGQGGDGTVLKVKRRDFR